MGKSLVEVALSFIESGRARIPVFPKAAARAQEMLRDDEYEPDELESLVASDPALASGVLRAANSTLYGGLERATTIRDASMRLGARKTCQLVIVFSQRQSYRMREPRFQAMTEMLWRHSIGCSLGADWLAKRLRLSVSDGEAMLAGLLHDVGKLYLLNVLDDVRASQPAFDPSDGLVREAARSLHTLLGDRLLEAWNIPDPYRRVVRRHHDADLDDADPLVLLIRLVDAVCNRMGIGLEPCPDLKPALLGEAQALRTSEVLLAELEIQIEDAMQIGSAAA